MTQLRGLTEFVEHGQPSIVRVTVLDAAGQPHAIVEKLPVVSATDELADAGVTCLLAEVSEAHASGRRVVTVDIACPWGCETVEGRTILEVFEDQLVASDEVWIAIDGALVEATRVGTNDGLNYGRFFEHEPLAYQAVLPIACLDWYGPEFAALVDEMREDDLRFGADASPFAKIDYRRTLAEAAAAPEALAEIVATHADRELLNHHFPFVEGRTELVINSTDTVWIVADQIVIRGRCWRLTSPA